MITRPSRQKKLTYASRKIMNIFLVEEKRVSRQMLGISAIWYHLVIVLHAHFPWSTLDPGAVFCKLFWTVYEFWKIKISLADKIECATFCFTMLSGWLAVGLFFSIKKSALEMVNLTNETVFYSILFSNFFLFALWKFGSFPKQQCRKKRADL